MLFKVCQGCTPFAVCFHLTGHVRLADQQRYRICGTPIILCQLYTASMVFIASMQLLSMWPSCTTECASLVPPEMSLRHAHKCSNRDSSTWQC